MSQPARRPACYEDLLALPDNVIGQIVDGELIVSPRPAGPHALAASALGISVGSPFQFGDGGPGGWWILDEPELHLGEDVLVPDLAGWRRERLPQVPEGHAFTLPPDWLCDVVSPSTARTDRVRKLPIYARVGVPYLRIVDPIARTLEAYRLKDERWVLLGTHGGEQAVREQPFEAVEMKLGRLWGSESPG